jgi:ribosomal protein S18 acetylase RimI-like enzyme
MVVMMIREALETDLPSILALYGQPDFDNGLVADLEDAREFLAIIGRYPEYRIYVAEAESGVIGVYSLLIMDKLAHKRTPAAILEDIVVATSLQRQGVGKAMIAHAMNMARSKGCYKLVLSSNMRRTDAHRFYDQLGFQRHGVSFHVTL